MPILELPAIRLAAAIGIGLLIGAERERRKGSGVLRGAAGARTFTFAAFAGALSSYLQSEASLVAVVSGAVIFSALAYRRTARKDPGLTTEFALIVTVLLGALMMQNAAHRPASFANGGAPAHMAASGFPANSKVPEFHSA
jgi:hypothetical protein